MIRVALIFIIFITVSCSSLPKQPKITSSEAKYFSDLMVQCNCVVTREVNPHVKKTSSEESNYYNGWYLLKLDNISCIHLQKPDSLRIVGLEYAKKIHKQVLNDDFNYAYNQINVIFNCHKSLNQSISKDFEYTLNELKGLTINLRKKLPNLRTK